METLRIFGHYSIVSEKIDFCPCKYHETISMIDMFTVLFSGLFCVGAVSHSDMMYVLVFFAIMCISALCGFFILDATLGCGTIITLKDNNYNDCTVKTKSYQFTDNPYTDALEIKKIMDDFEKYANEIDAVNKKRKEEEQKLKDACCDKYKSVISKVK